MDPLDRQHCPYYRLARQREYGGAILLLTIGLVVAILIVVIAAVRITNHDPSYVVRGATTPQRLTVHWW